MKLDFITINLAQGGARPASRGPLTPAAGQPVPATYRANVFASPGLSKKNIPNSRGTREDIPGWSHRPKGFGFKSINGGKPGDTKEAA